MHDSECKDSLEGLDHHADPTWGYYVYGIYTRPQGQDNDDSNTQKAADDARFRAVLSKLHAHATDRQRYGSPAPYNQRLVDTLRLEPAVHLPAASLADVCTHFCQHYAPLGEVHSEIFGPKHLWCLVIDDKSLQSIESAPDPIGPTPPEGVNCRIGSCQASNAFVKLLGGEYNIMEKPVVLSAQGRGGTSRRREWNG